jgi:ligand-binding sensor domain-containing protein
VKHLCHIKFIGTVLVLCLLAFNGRSQYESFTNYNVEQGLPSSEVYGVMQDTKGYIWIIGDMGVSRFNGYNFKNYSAEQGLPDNTFFSLTEDHKNRIWFCSFSGRLSFFKNDSIHQIPCNDTLALILRNMVNNSICIDKGDTIWLGTNRECVVKIAPPWSSQHVKKIITPRERSFFVIGNAGVVFAGAAFESEKVTAYNTSGEKLFGIAADVSLKNNSIRRFFVIRLRNGSYAMVLDNSIIHFNNTEILHKLKNKNVIIHLTEDKDGSLIASTYGGATMYSGPDYSHENRFRGLDHKLVTWSCIDRENGLWFTTEGHGVFCIKHRSFKYYTPDNGIPEGKISGFYSSDTITALGYLDGTVHLLEKDSSGSRDFRKIWKGADRINGFLEFGGSILVSSGKIVYQIKRDQVKMLDTLSKIGGRKILKSADGGIWVMSYGRIVKLDQNFKIREFISILSRADNIFEDSKGVLWIGTMNGIYTYSNKTLDYLGAKDSLFTYRSIEIGEDKDLNIWIATRGKGVMIINGKSILQINEGNGLAGNMCRTMYLKNDEAWIGTNKGLSRIRLKEKKIRVDNIYSRNGLLSNEVNFITQKDGKMWFVHNNGITICHPSEFKINTTPPPVYITSVWVNDSLYFTTLPPVLSYDKNYLGIDYIGLSYKDAGNLEYKYKMEGIDSNWTFTKYTSVKYQTIPKGSYRFIVYAKNNDGYWSTEPAVISFTILPAWWQTWIFRTVCVILLAGITFLLFKYRLNRIRKRENERLETEHQLATVELQALRAQMNPHFIFNAINSVQYFITENDSESSQKYLAKFARLIRYVVDNAKVASIPLETELDALGLYMELEALRFENKFDYKINVQDNVDVKSVYIPSMLIQPYVENAIWHGLMHKSGKGKIDININFTNKVLNCVIEDNGIGRKRSQEIKHKKGISSHKSLGMSISKARLDIFNKLNSSGLHVNIIDLEGKDISGTKVELMIPIHLKTVNHDQERYN